jgi:hypothetical protein
MTALTGVPQPRNKQGRLSAPLPAPYFKCFLAEPADPNEPHALNL